MSCKEHDLLRGLLRLSPSTPDAVVEREALKVLREYAVLMVALMDAFKGTRRDHQTGGNGRPHIYGPGEG